MDKKSAQKNLQICRLGLNSRMQTRFGLASLVFSLILAAFSTRATTFQQSYVADGADHSTNVFITSSGTHSFFVNGVPTGTYNYAAYKNTGGGYVEFWNDSTTTGWDPTATTSVSPGDVIKLTIWDGNWNVKSVYYWYIYLAQPDLRITTMELDNSTASDQHFDPGQSIRLDFVGYNGGTLASKRNVEMKWYYGASSGAKTTYIYFGSLGTANGLAIEESETETDASWSVPSTPGTYWLTAVIDSDGNNAESNEGNNEITKRFYVDAPDLIAYNVAVSDTSVDPGQSVTVTWTAKNQGGGNAPSSQQGVMWSANSTITQSDTMLDRELLGAMTAGNTTPETHEVTIPSDATRGQTYYIGVYADYDSEVNEGSYENNNGSSGVVVTVNTLPPEITVLLGSTVITDGQSTAIDFGSVVQSQTGPTKTFTVRNDGGSTLTLGSFSVTGYTVTESLSSSLAAGASDDFTVRLDSATTGTKSGSISFSNNDSNEDPFNFPITGVVTVPPTATITLTVKNGSTPVPNAVVQRYNNGSPWVYQDNKPTDANGQVSWTVASGTTWNFEAYYLNPTFGNGGNNPPYLPSQDQPEFWGGVGPITLTSGVPTSVDIQRTEPTVITQTQWPALGAVIVTRTDTGAVLPPGETVVAGTPLWFQFLTKNNASLTKEMGGRLLLDRDRTAPYDRDLPGGWAFVTAGANDNLGFAWTPQAADAGDYYSSPRAKVKLGNGNVWTSDSWGWSATPLVRVVASAPPKGITVITHGWQPSPTDFPKWPLFMARAVGQRTGSATLGKYDSSTGGFNLVTFSGDSPTISSTPISPSAGETILVFDWKPESDKAAQGWSEAAGDALFAALIKLVGDLNALDDFQWHFIGHSRGAIVNSETVERFATYGVQVSHVTTLDPHDTGNILDDWRLGQPQNGSSANSFGFTTWNNVIFADNYYSMTQDTSFCSDPDGRESWSKAWNLNLGNIGSLSPALIGHSGVHAWYRATIDMTASNYENACFNNVPILNEWFPNGLRTTNGWSLSRYGQSALSRPSLNLSNRFAPVWQSPSDAVFNGGFVYSDALGTPGWELHGGGGDAFVFSDLSGTFLRFDTVTQYRSTRTHNYFCLPSEATHLQFDYRITSAGLNDSLAVILVSPDNTYYTLGSVQVLINTDWVRAFRLLIPNHVPKRVPYKLLLALVDNNNASIASIVDVDNVRLESLADTTPPTVTINKAADQSDPTSSSPINFTVVFSESVTGFTSSDVTLGGTAGATTKAVTGSGTTYNVAVSGMTQSGNVTVTIPAAAAQDAAGNGNTASTSSDNDVAYNAPDVTPPTVTINRAAGQSDPTSTSPINFTVVFSESVTGFTGSDVTLGGTAGASSKLVSGSGTTYSVAVSGMTQSGTVTATIPADAAQDGAGNGNTPATWTDNSVDYNHPTPQLAITPLTLTNYIVQGQNATNQSFEVWNAGSATLNYTITDDATWMSVSPSGGNSTGGHNTIQIIYSTAGLTPGTLNGQITITAPGASGSPLNLAVVLTVMPPPALPNVIAWGDNSRGQTIVPSSLTNATSISAGSMHSLALREDGRVFAWGANFLGETNVPSGITNVQFLEAGESVSLAMMPGNLLASWGYNISLPTNATNVVALDTGSEFALALRSDNSVLAWGGNNYWGQTTIPNGLTSIVAVAAGTLHSLALKSDGTVVGWGWNGYGQTTVPLEATNIVAIAAGTRHSLALRNDGQVIVWGENAHGQRNVPSNATNIVDIEAGVWHNLALRADGSLVAWGNFVVNGADVPVWIPSGLEHVVSISGGGHHDLALLGSGKPSITVQPWSRNVAAGHDARMTVMAAGVQPTHYQWRFNGADIAGATSNQLMLSNVQFNKAGAYTVMVSNTLGVVTSKVATLTVNLPSPVVHSIQRSAGGQFSFQVTTVPGLFYFVEASDNLADWIVVAATNTTSAIFEYEELSFPPRTKRFYRVGVGAWPSSMMQIPSGIFSMGFDSTAHEGRPDESPIHDISVSAFSIDKFEVSKGYWDFVKYWGETNSYQFNNVGFGNAFSHPVHTINWFDAVKWCNARSQLEGRTACYYSDAALTEVYTNGQVTPFVKWNANGYRLPTEAEWEKAARGGASIHRFPWSDYETINHSRANYFAYPVVSPGVGISYDDNPTEGYHPLFETGLGHTNTSPVGYFAPNGYHLYDVAGNVLEWCWDWHGDYQVGFQTDPHGPTAGLRRVVRGGAWTSNASWCRVSARDGSEPENINYAVGFRCIRVASP